MAWSPLETEACRVCFCCFLSRIVEQCSVLVDLQVNNVPVSLSDDTFIVTPGVSSLGGGSWRSSGYTVGGRRYTLRADAAMACITLSDDWTGEVVKATETRAL